MFGAFSVPFCVWSSALCFWHVEFYHIWQNSTFCIFVLSREKKAKRAELVGVYHSRMLLERNRKRKREKCYRIGWKFHFHRENVSSVAAAIVFSTLEKFISKWVLSVFSHEFTSSDPPFHPIPNRVGKNTIKAKMDFKMNNKYSHTDPPAFLSRLA